MTTVSVRLRQIYLLTPDQFQPLSSFDLSNQMPRVYPNATATTMAVGRPKSDSGNAAVLTVWKKSLLFNCHGFTVFDSEGSLVYRVDNYMSGSKSQILLMDSAGNPMFTIHRRRLSIGSSWAVYEGDNTDVSPSYHAKKQVNILSPRCKLARVSGDRRSPSTMKVTYDIKGSYAQRSCAVYDNNKRKVVEVARKETAGGVCFGVDVFQLRVHPQIDCSLAMAIVILLDQMYE